MKLHHRLNEVRAARQRVADARRQSVDSAARLYSRVDAHPLITVGVAAGGGLLAGMVMSSRGKDLAQLWSDPTLRRLLGFLLVSVRGP
ncbi:MAG TPA: hypothetical protein VFJ01_07130 [Oleiagrimonas sp.]|nr:hypothetical protein [Oleiagrimonas sp.]